jgi:hypothetical protein
VRPLRGRFHIAGNDEQPYRPELVWDSECDEPDGISAVDSRPFAPLGYSGPTVHDSHRGWLPGEREAALIEAAEARLARRG